MYLLPRRLKHQNTTRGPIIIVKMKMLVGRLWYSGQGRHGRSIARFPVPEVPYFSQVPPLLQEKQIFYNTECPTLLEHLKYLTRFLMIGGEYESGTIYIKNFFQTLAILYF